MTRVEELEAGSPRVRALPRGSNAIARAAKAFLAMMIVLVTAPPLLALLHPAPIMALDEHRNPAPAPDFALLAGPHVASFADQMNAWFDDRIGLRDLFIRAKNQIDVSLFRVHHKIYLGKDDWLFQRSLIEMRLALERVSEAEYQKRVQSFFDLAALLRRRGMRLVVVDYPDKSEFYSEYLPSDVPNLPRSGRLTRLRQALDADPEIIHIDVGKLLQPVKRAGEPLYYKTDIHANPHGQIPVIKEIVRRIAASEGRSDIAWNETFHFEAHDWWGDEARFLALLHPVVEPGVWAPEFYEVGKPAADGHWVVDDPRRVDYPDLGEFPVFDFAFFSNPDLCPQRLPAAAVFGDSFSDLYWPLGLQRYFCQIRRARNPIERLGPYIEDLPKDTKYLIYSFLDPLFLGEAPVTVSASGPTASYTIKPAP